MVKSRAGVFTHFPFYLPFCSTLFLQPTEIPTRLSVLVDARTFYTSLVPLRPFFPFPFLSFPSSLPPYSRLTDQSHPWVRIFTLRTCRHSRNLPAGNNIGASCDIPFRPRFVFLFFSRLAVPNTPRFWLFRPVVASACALPYSLFTNMV